MFLISKRNFFRGLAIFSMVVLFLPVVVYNIPEPFDFFTKTLLLAPIWLIAILFHSPNLLLSKYLLVVYLLFLVLLLGSLTIWSDTIITNIGHITLKWIIIDIFGAFLSILMYQFFIRSEDYKGLALVSIIALFFVLITAVTSIRGLFGFPEAVRNLASGRAGDMLESYQRMGIANYNYIASIVYLFPILVCFIRNEAFILKSRLLISLYVLLLLFFLLKSEFTTALVLSIIFIVFSIFIQKKYGKTSVLILLIIYLVIFQFNSLLADLFHYISNFVNSETLKIRFNDIGNVLEFRDYSANSGKTYFSDIRLSLVKMSFMQFLKNPLIGGGWGGAHSTWVDRLGLFGLIGFFPWVIIFWQQVRLNFSLLSDSYKPYYLMSVFSCVLLGTLTTMANSPQSGVMVFLIVPGLNYIGYLKCNSTPDPVT